MRETHERAAGGPEAEPAEEPGALHRRLLRRVCQAWRAQEHRLRPLALPRGDSGAQEVRATGLEPQLSLQYRRPLQLCSGGNELSGEQPQDPMGRPQVHLRRNHVRGTRDRLLRPDPGVYLPRRLHEGRHIGGGGHIPGLPLATKRPLYQGHPRSPRSHYAPGITNSLRPPPKRGDRVQDEASRDYLPQHPRTSTPVGGGVRGDVGAR
mmetsp:Transcript_62838/g.144010  ORF Transcript_62838/g.144010 Transcript_62838/m.144010 type:complete len:208 (-) Transcript_62838:875-1498(-)